MESIFTSEGRAIYNPTATPKYRYEYQYKDNTGDVTLVFSDLNNDGAVNTSEVIQQTTYYPFGLDFYGTNYNQIGVVNKFKFNGKELQDDFGLNLYDYGARHYDPVIGRWGVADELGEINETESPYCYVGNNPLSRIDPDGKNWWDIIVGAAIGTATNVVPGSTNLRGLYTPTDAEDYNGTLQAVDIGAMTLGGAAVIGGGGAVGTGGAVALAGGTLSVTGAGAVVGAPAAVAGTAVAAVGAVTAVAGAAVISNATANQSAGYNYGREQSKGGNQTQKQSKVEKTKTTEKVGDFTKTTEVRPGKGPGQSRAEYIRYKNADGKTIKNVKDSYDRAGNFQHRKDKPLPK